LNLDLLNDMRDIGNLFDNLSAQYDRFNHLTSLGIDRLWRKQAIRAMHPANQVLDVAIGTADLTIEILRQGKAQHIEGIDLSAEMMRVGQEKVNRLGWGDRVHFTQGSAQKMPYADHSFDILTCAYGVRNFSDLDAGLREFYRVLKPGGQLIILEFSHPKNKIIELLYRLYFRYFMTIIGQSMTHDKAAFLYFYQSVKNFIWGEEMQTKLQQHGFKDVHFRTMTFGISTLYLAQKQ